MSKQDVIMEILEDYQYKNTDKGIFVYVETANGKEEVLMNSQIFYSLIADDYRTKCGGKTVGSKTVKECVFNYAGTILRKQKRIKTNLRICSEKDGSVLRIDLGNKRYEYIEVTAEGWNIRTDGDKYFTRNIMQGELPKPSRNGDLMKIFDYCRIPENMKNIFIAYIVSCFIDIIHPCLVLQGTAGSSKSTLSTLLKMLIDPCDENNTPCIFPRNESGLVYMYCNNYFVAYDNLQRLTQKQSDFLCAIITGSQFLIRKLFTDAGVCRYILKQPVVLNGISGVVNKKDMIDRSIIIDLLPMDQKERKSERKLIEDFRADLPVILGGIMDVLVETVATYKPESIEEPPRLIEFYEYGYYICNAVNKNNGKLFCEEYWKTITKQKGKKYENYELKETLDYLLDENGESWYGTMSELSNELYDLCENWEQDGIEMKDQIPLIPNRLSKELNLLDEYLKENGILISRSRNSKNYSAITIYRAKTVSE